MRIGVLALQGDFLLHMAVLSQLDCEPILLKSPDGLEGIDGIVLPGGESTTMAMLLESSGIYSPLKSMLKDGLPAFGTCAGMILLASEIFDGRSDQVCLEAIDISVRRNGFGRQIASFESDIEIKGIDTGPMRAAFIRAPIVERIGVKIEVLAEVEHTFNDLTARTVPVVCRQDNVLVCSFHPEVAGDNRLHKMFIDNL